MAANMKDPRTFFTSGTPAQYEYVYNLYEEAVKLKAIQKNKKVADYLKLDKWFQNELPKRIKSRGKDAHLIHEELVQCMKWKLARGKFSPRIKDLVQMNTPRLCITETKKAFRALLKKDDLSSAIQALCNLKGVGPAMASVMLTAADAEQCGFMADECLLAIPEIESIDYTTKELLNFVDQLKSAATRLNNSGGSGWNAHKVEQALWALFVLNDNKKELLDDMPSSDVAASSSSSQPAENGTDAPTHKNGDNESSSDSADSNANKENVTRNGAPRPEDDSNDSLPSAAPATNDTKMLGVQEDTNDSVASSACSSSGGAQRPEDDEDLDSKGEEDSMNAVSPSNQISEDTNDSVTAAASLTNGSNGASKPAQPLDDDDNSLPQAVDKNESQDALHPPSHEAPSAEEEPAAKKAKLAE
ncbi:uncharacterized protein LOC108675159 [Hyalella azteca]|uniref:Uncharacterized protein LOC108675159 n=1 Tax=Hyalella azteca TaxID=294128 RepID=A0A8B7NXU8_HYAAZ|nr:uncharacterized protein LOC108675159 [Hyalella azteca]